MYSSEAASGGLLQENVFFNILHNSQENTCARVSFLIKKRLWLRCFPVNFFAKFLRRLFYRKPLGDCFWQLLLIFQIISKKLNVFSVVLYFKSIFFININILLILFQSVETQMHVLLESVTPRLKGKNLSLQCTSNKNSMRKIRQNLGWSLVGKSIFLGPLPEVYLLKFKSDNVCTQGLVDELCTVYDCLCPLNKATINENLYVR